MRWVDGRVSVEDSVEMQRAPRGSLLRDSFLPGMSTLTMGLVRAEKSSLRFGPLELLRFGRPRVTGTAVEWSIEGGLLAGAPGGTWRLHSSSGRLVASVNGYRPLLPAAVYSVTQLPLHHLLTRLYLLRLRGRDPAPGVTATSSSRMRASLVDLALCATLAGMAGRRRRVRTVLGIAVVYHVACWSLTGRTLGGLVMRQRVVTVDGSRLSPAQALVRLFALPLSLIRGRPDHDEIACTDVVVDEP